VVGIPGTVPQAEDRGVRTDHIPDLRIPGLAAVPGTPRGSRGKEERPVLEVLVEDRGPCTCEEEVPCWAGRAQDRNLDLENCSLLSVHFLLMLH